MASPLVEALARFNRKERFWLLADALGEPFLELSVDFLKKLGAEIGVEIPSKPWWSFDYHLDWLFAALSTGPAYDLTLSTTPRDNGDGFVKGSQEDADLIIAFDQTIILVEAKLSTAWSNAQMESKVKRLHSLPVDHVRMFLVLSSPGKSARLKYFDWPVWALKNKDTPEPYHVPLDIKAGEHNPLMVSRCSPDNTKSRTGTHWNIFGT